MPKAVVLTILSCLSLLACTGTETGNPPVVDFGNSGCHDQSYSKGRTLQSLDPAVPDPQYKGLTCMTWQRVDENTVQIQLTNYESGCASDQGWKPLAELREDGGLDLILEDVSCITAGCGWCLYDLTFTVALDQPVTDGEVRIYQRGCPEIDAHPKRASLALATEPSGAVCTYAHRAALNWKSGAPGTERMPCGAESTSPTCEPDLTCTDVGGSPTGSFSGGERCLAKCTDDSGCDDLSRCEDGVCRLRAPGVFSE